MLILTQADLTAPVITQEAQERQGHQLAGGQALLFGQVAQRRSNLGRQIIGGAVGPTGADFLALALLFFLRGDFFGNNETSSK